MIEIPKDRRDAYVRGGLLTWRFQTTLMLDKRRQVMGRTPENDEVRKYSSFSSSGVRFC